MHFESFAKNISKYRKELMGLSALFIFIFHTHAVITKGFFAIGETEEFIKRILFYGVDIFMLLSGFGVVYSLNKNNPKQFYLNRIIRIYPTVIIIGLVYKFTYGWKWINFFKRVLGIAFFSNMYSFLWFFTAILILYLFSPFFYFILKKINNKFLFSIFFFCSYVILVNILNAYLNIGDYYGFLNRIPIYVFGMILGMVSLNGKTNDNSITKKELLLALICFFIGLYLAYLTNYKGFKLLVPISNCFLPNIVLSFSTIYLVISLLKLENNCINLISKLLRFFGNISFEFYVLQELISDKLHLFLSTYGHFDAVKFNLVCLLSVTISANILHKIVMFLSFKLNKVMLNGKENS